MYSQVFCSFWASCKWDFLISLSDSFFCGTLRFCLYSLMIYANSGLHTLLLLSSQFGCLLFLFLVWLLCWPPILRWVKSGGGLVPALTENAAGSPHWVRRSLWLRHVTAFVILRCVPSLPTLLRVFIAAGCWICQMLFRHLLIWSCDLCPSFCLCGL